MRVLHLDTGKIWRGGQQQIHYLAEGLSHQGIEQHLVVSGNSKLAERLSSQRLPFSTLRFSAEWDLASILGLLRIVKRFCPDIIHSHDSRSLGIAVAVKAVRPGFRLVASRRVAFSIRSNPLWRIKYRKMTDHIIAVSRYIRDALIDEGIYPDKVSVVYDGFQPPTPASPSRREALRNHLGVSAEDILIGTVGHFTPEKGHEILIHGFRTILQDQPRARLILAGDGELKPRYAELIRDLGLGGHVIMPGPFSDFSSVLPALDVFVLPSLQEGLGSILLVAMAHRIPVVASRTGGIPELVIDGETGLLFTPGNSVELSHVLWHAWQSGGLLKSCATNAFCRVTQDFRVERMVADTCEIYANVLRS